MKNIARIIHSNIPSMEESAKVDPISIPKPTVSVPKLTVSIPKSKKNCILESNQTAIEYVCRLHLKILYYAV